MSASTRKLFGLALFGSSFTLSAFISSAALADEPAAKDEGPAGLFKQLDINGDGELTKDEIPADKKTLAERLFRNADKNNDGKLTAAEFKAGLEKQAEPAPERTPGTRPFGGNRGPQGQGGEQLWRMLDRNGTGSVKPSDVPEERRERFTKMLEVADTNKDGALSKEEFEKFTARTAPREGGQREGTPGRERPQAGPREGERREAGPRDGDRPAEGRRPEGDRPRARPEERPEMRREGDRPAEARPAGRPDMVPGGPRGPGGVGIFFILDTDRDGRLSKSELENAAKVLSKLDRNGDGELTLQELMPEGRPEIRRPESDRPATREGERRPEARGDGERRPAGPRGGERPPTERDGDKPREGDKPRDGDKPKTE